jgi:hypothetical protein
MFSANHHVPNCQNCIRTVLLAVPSAPTTWIHDVDDFVIVAFHQEMSVVAVAVVAVRRRTAAATTTTTASRFQLETIWQ